MRCSGLSFPIAGPKYFLEFVLLAPSVVAGRNLQDLGSLSDSHADPSPIAAE
jgi:hypothetical protein